MLAHGPSFADGIVAEIVKAPVVPDGDVVSAPTDITINLAIDPDPQAPGLALEAGDRIRIALPDDIAMVDAEEYPVSDFLSGPDCSVRLKCSTVILLQGWPQHPILPSFPPGETPIYSLGYDGVIHAMTLDIHTPLAEAPLPGPGLKQIHLALLGFHNPETPGDYPIEVDILGADGTKRVSGVGTFHVRPEVAPSLNVASIFDENGAEPPNRNTIYQVTTPGQKTPLPWDFLVWGASGAALDGLQIAQDDESGGRLLHGNEVVGRFTIEAPEGAEGQRLDGGPAKLLAKEPVFGGPFPTGHLTAHFTAGSVSGRYSVELALDNGDAVTMVVDARED